MATSGTTAFTLDFTEIAEEAWERAGAEMRTGYQARTARRSMNLLLLEWQNRGINLWTVENGELDLTAGTGEYNLPADTIDLLDQVIRTNSGETNTQLDLSMTRYSVNDWAAVPNKLNQGRPINFWLERLVANPVLHVWPVPDTNDYKFVYWRIRRMEDAGSGVETPDVNARFFPALVAGLAYQLALKTPNLTARAAALKEDYEQQFNMAANEDRDKTALYIRPNLGIYRR